MKLSKETLKQIIKEELNSLLQETSADDHYDQSTFHSAGYYKEAAGKLDDLLDKIGETEYLQDTPITKQDILSSTNSFFSGDFKTALRRIKQAMAMDGKSPQEALENVMDQMKEKDTHGVIDLLKSKL